LTIPGLRRWAFLDALVLCTAIAIYAIAELVMHGPSVGLDVLLGGDMTSIFALAGVRRRRP